METKLRNILKEKGTICVALDFNTTKEIINQLHILGPHVGLFKLHCDIIDDFNIDFINELNILKRTHNFLIWEDRKFSDIGFITHQQLHNGIFKISSWADIITCHSTCGYKSIPELNNIGVFLVVELSVSNHLCDSNYIEKSIQIANDHPSIIGVVCQHNPINLKQNILKVVPGISHKTKTDNYNQTYDSIENKSFGDIFVIGRAITTSKNPLEELQKLKIKN